MKYFEHFSRFMLGLDGPTTVRPRCSRKNVPGAVHMHPTRQSHYIRPVCDQTVKAYHRLLDGISEHTLQSNVPPSISLSPLSRETTLSGL